MTHSTETSPLHFAAPPPRLRFAPSPNGPLHLGHALSAIVNFELAQRLSGQFLVRIEDIDTGRAREEFINGIFEDLKWLGLEWEQPVLRQSTRFAAYAAATEVLREAKLIYPCFATRAEISAAVANKPNHACDPDGAPLYPGLYKHMHGQEFERQRTAGEAFAWRLDMQRALAFLKCSRNAEPLSYIAWDGQGSKKVVVAQPAKWGDAVIVRKDVAASYHLAVVVDDAHQEITHVVRGEDLEPATDLHRLLQELLGLASPLYHHHGLVRDPAGRKLSKSVGDTSLAALRHAGMRPDNLRQHLTDVLRQSGVDGHRHIQTFDER